MTINSMTGFARASGAAGDLTWQWELKSVNGKALDVRLRLAPGYDQLEIPARAAITAALKRGNIQASLTVSKPDGGMTMKINEALLSEYAALADSLRVRLGGGPIQAEQLLALRGVVEQAEDVLSESKAAARDKAMLASLHDAVAELGVSRAEEGARLKAVIAEQMARISNLAIAARDAPARSPEAIRTRLKEQISRLLETGASFDEARLHQEAVLIATRADIQEELDRLTAHIEAAQDLLASREPIGRKFDFLAQEFNREANTLCSKASDRTLTAIGLDLKTVIDQMREQVQNIE